MPENILERALAAPLLLGLTGLFFGLHSAEAASITNLTDAQQTVETSAAGKDFTRIAIEAGKTYTTPGDLVVHYHNMNVRMGDNQELILLKNGSVRLQTHFTGSSPKNPPKETGPDKRQPAKSDEGLSI